MEQNTEYIDLLALMGRVWKRKRLYMTVLAVTFLLSCALIVCVPRTYSCSMTMVPEESDGASVGTLGSIASSFGIDLNMMASTDAITPLVYPDVLESPQFISTILPVKVRTLDGSVETNYYDYLLHHTDKAWWTRCSLWVKRMLPKKADPLATDDPEVKKAEAEGRLNIFRLTQEQSLMMEGIASAIDYTFDKKTGVITLGFVAQDPLVVATMLDSISVKLQEFIIEYRTRKTRNDMEYYRQLTEEAHGEYLKAARAYSDYVDANKGINSQSSRVRQDNLENEMNVQYQAYSAFHTQYQAARAKVQERTPAFSVIQPSSIPAKATGPKRMLFVIAMCFLACIVTTGYLFWNDIRHQLTHLK